MPAFSIHLSRSTGNRNIMLKAVLLGFLMRLTACSMQQYRTHDDNTERDKQTNKQKKRTSILLANPIMLIYYAVMILKMPSVWPFCEATFADIEINPPRIVFFLLFWFKQGAAVTMVYPLILIEYPLSFVFFPLPFFLPDVCWISIENQIVLMEFIDLAKWWPKTKRLL